MRTKKELGQHWLYDVESLNAMKEAAQVNATDTILEIGPGMGTLTEYLLADGANVIAVEYDKEVYEYLVKEASSLYSADADRLKIINADILSFDLTQLPKDYKVVANIPYYLTSNLVRVLSESINPPQSVTLLIQKEVAERIAAGAGQMSMLSVTAQMYFEPTLHKVVPAKLFTPPPKVDSQIIHLQRRKLPLFGDADSKMLFRIVKAGFSNRRKTLLNSLSGGLQASKEQTKILLEHSGIDGQKRAQDLTLLEWIKLADTYIKTV